MKGYPVFNVEQIDGLSEHYYQRPQITLTPVERNARAEEFFRNTGADLDLTSEVREDQRSYLACWLQVLQNDKRAIFSAAAHA